MSKITQLWDQKSSKYPRFNGTLNPFSHKVFSALKELGVKFGKKSVIDIGCGTGVYTLYIAKLCEEITGVDSSEGMLEILKQDALTFDIKNLKIIKSYWLELQAQKHYDIAISTMSPAIREDDDFAKFDAMADTKIYLNFSGTRSSSLLKPFFAHYGVKSGNGSSVATLQNWLEANDKEYKKVDLKEKRVAIRSKTEAIENVYWHLEINGVRYDKNEILAMIDEIKFKGDIKDEINSSMSLFVF